MKILQLVASIIIITVLICGLTQLVGVNKGLLELQGEIDKQTLELRGQVDEPPIINCILPSEITLLRDAPPLMVLRFDDGLKEHYDVVRPLLDDRGWEGTFVVPCSHVGMDEFRMTITDLKILASVGHEISCHGWTHAYSTFTQVLTADAFEGESVLTLDTMSGFGGGLSDKYYMKTKLSDDANPDGEYIEIIGKDDSLLQVKLREGVQNDYTVADNATLKMDRECILTHFTEMERWFRYTTGDQLYLPLTIIPPGGDVEQQEYWWMYAARDFLVVPSQNSYYTSNWRINKGISETVLRYKGVGSISHIYGHNKVEQVRAVISNRAQSGLVTQLVWHDIKDSHPDYGDDLNEFKSILDLIDSLGYQVVTLATAGQIIRQNSNKDVVLCFYEDNLNASSIIDTGVPVDLAGFRSVVLTAEATYHNDATVGAKLRVYSSADEGNWDTAPTYTRTLTFEAGETRRETFIPSDIVQRARYLKVILENLDADYEVFNVKVVATLGT